MVVKGELPVHVCVLVQWDTTTLRIHTLRVPVAAAHVVISVIVLLIIVQLLWVPWIPEPETKVGDRLVRLGAFQATHGIR
jgi:hypothetical protein